MIEIGMNPIVFTIGPFTVAWHGLLTGVAVLVGAIMVVRLAKGTGVAIEDVYPAALWAILGGIVGARLVYVIDQWEIYRHDLWQILHFWEGGLSLFGAICGGFLIGALYCILRKLPAGRLADLAAPGVLLAQAIGRIGCLINGDAYGTPTSLPWGVLYTHPNTMATTKWVELAEGQNTYIGHPVPVYEIIWDLLIFVILWRLRRRVKKDWIIFLLYASMYSFARFFLSFVRGDEEAVLGGLHQAQLMALLALVVTIPLLIWLFKRPTRNSQRLQPKEKG